MHGHFSPKRTAKKVLGSGMYWDTLFKDAYFLYKTGGLSRRNEMPQVPILFYEVFDVWEIDFMEHFLFSCGFRYILLAMDYISKWVEAKATITDDAKVVAGFLKANILCRYGFPKAIISDQESHFYNQFIASLLKMYGVQHRIATLYHLQTNGQAEVSNRE
ncbi:uncharacterized protein K02A2.6-like [Benincasa hispida]|uniref:uncharacterized protein K02A2.6-like n=1 Tax=Benincasa hispida TaxID=102211 RepID=UPI001901E56A|nr:uncharacterized protein K02A2.6-like [Benincasa hispida]